MSDEEDNDNKKDPKIVDLSKFKEQKHAAGFKLNGHEYVEIPKELIDSLSMFEDTDSEVMIIFSNKFDENGDPIVDENMYFDFSFSNIDEDLDMDAASLEYINMVLRAEYDVLATEYDNLKNMVVEQRVELEEEKRELQDKIVYLEKIIEELRKDGI